MKGVVFTEFMEMVEGTFGDDVLDDIIDASKLPNDGAYTAVGTYPASELISLVVNLSKQTNTPVDKLVFAFGEYLFKTFARSYGIFFEGVNDIFDFLESIERYIHVEVRKLYPDAELPSFDCQRMNPNKLIMDYQSERAMSDLAHGLISQAAVYFEQPLEITKENIGDNNGTNVRFTLVKK